jgi:hypothetical protein
LILLFLYEILTLLSCFSFLMTGETVANRDSRSSYERILPWLVDQARRAGTIDFSSALVALVGPVENIFSSLHNISLQLSQGVPKRFVYILADQ